MAVADFHIRPHGFSHRQFFSTHPVQLCAHEAIGEDIASLADDHFIGIRPDLGDEYPTPHGKIQAAPLPHRVVDDAFVLSQHFSGTVHEVSRGIDPAAVRRDKSGVIIIRHKADFLAVRLMGHRQPGPLSHGPDFILGIGAVGHKRPGQLLLGQVVESVGLIFFLGY